jgi:hypothetical protein
MLNCLADAGGQRLPISQTSAKGSVFHDVPVAGRLSAALLEWKAMQERFKGKRIRARVGHHQASLFRSSMTTEWSKTALPRHRSAGLLWLHAAGAGTFDAAAENNHS